MSGIKVCVIPTPERDAEMYDNTQGGYVRKTSKQLTQLTNTWVAETVESAKQRAKDNGFPVINGRFDLWGRLRSDEVEEAVELLQQSIAAAIGPGYFITFVYYEKHTESAVLDNVRDLTFQAARATTQ